MPRSQISSLQKFKKKSSKSDDDQKGKALAEALTFLKQQWGWSGKDFEQVTRIDSNTVNTWLANKKVPVETPYSANVQIILHLLAIHRDLDSMFEKSETQLKWLNTKHPDFDEAPIEQMKESIEGLIDVRRYLDYVRGRGA